MAGKRYKKDRELVDSEKLYSLDEALDVLASFSKVKFDEAVDVAINLDVDAKQTDQMVRGAISLPHGIGKTVRVAVFAIGEKAKEAEDAGADVVGGEELAQKIQAGWMEFDKTIATPDMMVTVGKLGKVLGPRGMMPNPKLGTVTNDLAKAVKETKGGKVEFRIDKAAVVHAPVGKRSFGNEKLKENLQTLLDAVVKAKPAAAKGVYLRKISLSATMTPGVQVDPASFGV
ncbi:MAG: 50S ribosomal protein L1 [Deltaproteobacteria bacterium CG_4_10_14_0_2_um_filter_43_8]|nr:MAG: 50S ribosomal protein L1 [Deltaproteobacteria bacterium CG11_big_fil_rev_8_21_14_0_20_42_23]PJA20732.1 MAG: 50S ribosomal protein L1 [Deltaproteobacteria bacterium CG_4_10_14_0_2_um_filter_43_8]PJC63956.1 MAG: 50S ribosomal protein L1 [Deltaproteobacteria bacterium CG_4_9_14_0_2_um_filter_42_21]